MDWRIVRRYHSEKPARDPRHPYAARFEDATDIAARLSNDECRGALKEASLFSLATAQRLGFRLEDGSFFAIECSSGTNGGFLALPLRVDRGRGRRHVADSHLSRLAKGFWREVLASLVRRL